MRDETAPPAPSVSPSKTETEPMPNSAQPSRGTKRWLIVAGIVIVILAGGWWLWHHGDASKPAASSTTTTQTTATSKSSLTTSAEGLQLDTSKNYGDKYADGILPVGDGKYTTNAAKQGYIYTCSGYAHNLQAESGGAGKRGPWFTNNNTEYDVNQKLRVQGSMMWRADFSNTVNGSTRTVVTNDLPSHPTGIFPIAATDPAYAYDKNPNGIKDQTLTYSLPLTPSYGSPNCMGGQSGVMLTGVALFNGFDAGGRDAGAWEIQDSCDGHPQSGGEYHYHTLSSCITNISVHTVIGFALDGFPITGPQVSAHNILTTADLDECHGITSQIGLDGKTVTMYHYVMTQDFPYSVSCFRAPPIQPPGMQPQPH
jgi:hypothetical protein